MKITKLLLIQEINHLIQEIKFSNPKRESLEWYLLNNLNTYLMSIEHADGSDEIKNATKIFGMFCTDGMDWNTDLYKKCMELTQVGLRLSKQE